MPLASKSVNGDGSNTSFNFPFDYLDTSHISVLVDGVSTSFTFASTYILTVSPAPGNGLDVTIQRTTPNSTPLVDFSGGSVLLESDLDTATTQSLYVAQETVDSVDASISKVGSNWDAESLQIKSLSAGTASTDAVNKAQLDAATIASGNVPTPGDPADDGKVLVAGSGLFSWANIAYTAITGMAANVVSILAAADYAAIRTLLGLRVGTEVQAYDADLSAVAGLTSAANKIVMFSGAGAATTVDLLDEDNMTSDSTAGVPTQQSTKAYVDTAVAAVVSGALEYVGSAALPAQSTFKIASGGTPDITHAIAAGYDYIIALEAFAPATDLQNLAMRFSDDGGTTFEADSSDYEWGYNQESVHSRDEVDTEIHMTDAIGNDANNTSTLEVILTNPGGTSELLTSRWSGFAASSDGTPGPHIQPIIGAGVFTQGVDAVDGVQFSWSSGNFKAQGDVTVWRRRRS